MEYKVESYKVNCKVESYKVNCKVESYKVNYKVESFKVDNKVENWVDFINMIETWILFLFIGSTKSQGIMIKHKHDYITEFDL